MTVAVILAGGLGTRLREVVPDLPKPMAPIKGRPFLELQMDYWINQGIKRFIISVGYLYEVITTHFGSLYKGIPIEFVIEKTPLGTGGGLLLAASNLNESFILLNGDTFFEVDMATLLNFHTKRNSDWTFSLFRTHENKRYMGLNVAQNGSINSLMNNSDSLEQLSNGGVYFVNSDILRQFKADIGGNMSLEDDILPSILDSGGFLYGLECQGNFIDIGIPEDYFRAEELIAT